MPISLSRNPSYFQGIPALSVLLSVENYIFNPIFNYFFVFVNGFLIKEKTYF